MTERRIRVLHCVGSMDRGGVETWLLRVLRQIDPKRFALDFCCFSGRSGAYAEEIEASGAQIHACQLSPDLLNFNRRFAQLLHEGQYDIVHSHVHLFSGYILWRACRAGIQGRIAHSHNTADARPGTLQRRFYRAWMRHWIQRYANAGVAASTEAGAALFGPNWRFDPRWCTIYCGVDVEPFLDRSDRNKVRAELGCASETLLMGHVGRFDPQKNHTFLIDIAQEVIALYPDSQFVLVGDGVLRPRIEEKVQALGLRKKILFTGLRSDVPALLSAMDLFLMPSHHEGLPVAGLEAQATGLPTVFSENITREACVVPELVTYLSLDLPPHDWAQQLLTMSRREVDAAARRSAFEQRGFAIGASVTQLEALYESLVGANHD